MASAIIIDTTVQKAKTIKSIEYPIAKIVPIQNGISINEVLPFRIRFTTIGIPPSYSGVPGIGLQIIGINNYII